jgi:putative ABC transport system permease protein
VIRPRFVLAFAWRESRGGAAARRLLLLASAVAVGVAAVTAIGSFADNLFRSVDDQARALLGGDLALSANAPFSPRADSLVDSLAMGGAIARSTSFSAMAYVPRSGSTRLSEVRAIEPGYPFYGPPATVPAGLWPRLRDGRYALVEPSFLTSLSAAVGDTVRLGEASFVILGTVDDARGNIGIRSAFGPRVWIPMDRLGATRLLGFGSRASYSALVRVPPGTDAEKLADRFRARLRELQLNLRTVQDNQDNLKDFFEQLARFLGLVALVALLLGGIGVASAIQVFLRRKRETIAVLRCLGATSGEVFAIYLGQAAALGLIGSLAGVTMGLGIQLLLPQVFARFLPLAVEVRPSPPSILLGLGLGLWVSLAFALLPLLAVRDIPPLAVLRQPYDERPLRAGGRTAWVVRLLLAASVAGLSMLQVREVVRGAIFAAGMGGALLVLWLAALALIRALRRWFPAGLAYVFRQGLANLYRPANQTVAVVLALGAGVFLLGALSVVRHNLLVQFSLEAGPNRPNFVLFDIQPDQIEPLRSLLKTEGLALQAPVPIVPMRVSAINGRSVAQLLADTVGPPAGTPAAGARPAGDQPAREGGRRDRGPGGGRDRGPEGGRSRWPLRREYRSTYRDSLVGSEKLVVGDFWGAGQRDGTAPYPISMESSIAGDLEVTIRDTVVWDIQGVPLTTVVTSLREVDWARFEPNFFVVFPTAALRDAPQMFVQMTRINAEADIGRIQRLVVQRFPNVTTVDLSLVQRTIEGIVASVVSAIRFMALFSLATGLVVLIGALATSRYQRMREAALLKTLGATRGQVMRVMVTEYAALGVLASIVALALAALGGWALVRYVFEVPFSFPWLGFSGLAVTMTGLTVATGLWSSTEVFRRTPMEVLRTE